MHRLQRARRIAGAAAGPERSAATLSERSLVTALR
jgi:hypothetical protein